MSPTCHESQNPYVKREPNAMSTNTTPPHLRINKDSHFIKKSPPSSTSPSSPSSSSVVTGAGPAALSKSSQQRHPVIIYTHSPKVIHTHPHDFMALVQKLTGFSRSEDDVQVPRSRAKYEPSDADNEENGKTYANKNDDNESSSVVTDDNNGSGNVGDGQVNSCLVSSIFDPPNPCFNNLPFFNPNSTDFFSSNPPFYNYPDSLLLMPKMRSSMSSPTLDDINELPEL